MKDNILSITILTPQGKWDTSVVKTTKIAEVLQAVVNHFGFASNGNYELRAEKDPDVALKPDRPLVSYGIQDGDKLVFTDLGVAVWR
jgi:hypothetical protein